MLDFHDGDLHWLDLRRHRQRHAFTSDGRLTAPAGVTRYIYKSTWGTPSAGTVDLSITFDPSGFNDPAAELNGAGADAIGARAGVTSGAQRAPMSGRLMAVVRGGDQQLR